jgi:hypothetical protein
MRMSVFWLDDDRARPATSHHVLRLHRRPLNATTARASVAEVVGTFILVLTIASVVIAAGLAKPIAGAAYGSLAVAAAGAWPWPSPWPYSALCPALTSTPQ